MLGDALAVENLHADAREAYETALNADSFLRSIRQVINGLVTASLGLQRFDDAEQWCSTARSRYPEDPRFVQCHLMVLGNRGRSASDVKAAWDEVRRIDADTTKIFASSWASRQSYVAAILARAGMADSARAVMARTQRELNGRPRAFVVEAYVDVLLGDRESAIGVLSEMVQADARSRIGLARNPWFKSLEGDQRFRALTLRN
jgi:hypothetical protein